MSLPNDALIHVCNIMSRESTYSSDNGQINNTWSVAAANVRCRRDSLKYSRYLSATADSEKVSDIILVNESSAVQFLVTDNQIVIGSETFRIIRKNVYYEEQNFAGVAKIDHYEIEVILIQ